MPRFTAAVPAASFLPTQKLFQFINHLKKGQHSPCSAEGHVRFQALPAVHLALETSRCVFSPKA